MSWFCLPPPAALDLSHLVSHAPRPQMSWPVCRILPLSYMYDRHSHLNVFLDIYISLSGRPACLTAI